MQAIALGYHDVIDPASGQRSAISLTRRHYALDLLDFRDHLQAIACSGAEVDHATPEKVWGACPVFLTFDDGAECAFTIVADELEKHGWRGHFFITTDWIGRAGFLTRHQIRDLHRRGHAIGSHSCSHPSRMSHLSNRELDHQWQHSCSILRDIVDEEVSLASVPDGYFSQRVAKAASQAGIKILFTSEPRTSASIINGTLVVGRYFICRDSPAELSGKVAAGCRWPRWQQSLEWQLKKPIKAIGGEHYLRLRRYLFSHSLAQ